MPAEFDEQMQRRLRAFQEHHGLTTDGVAGTQTWTTLMSSAPAAANTGGTAEQPAANAQAIPLSDFPQLHALLAAESTDRWLADLGIGAEEPQEDEEAQA